MYYASFGILAVIHHIIINHEILKNGKGAKEGAYFWYRRFLRSILIFYIADLLWGFLEELKIRYLVYADTMVFFASMAVSVLIWTKFVVAFLDKKGRRAAILVAGGWVIFGFVILHLFINLFVPVIFQFTEESEYIPETGRYFLLAAQLLMFVVVTIYSFVVAVRATGRDKVHYLAVSLSSGVMAVLIVLQSLYPFAPFYTIGCFIANCLIHVFVEADEKLEQDRITTQAKEGQITFGQIAESLASNYDVIYYVEIATGHFTGFTSQNIYGTLQVGQRGEDFFAEAMHNTGVLIHPQDRERIKDALDKDRLFSRLDRKRQFAAEYRMIVDNRVQYTRFTARKSSDGKHFIIGVENIDDEVRKENEHLRALNTEKELARRDELTGIRNKTAFTELEQSIQNNIDRGMNYLPFAFVVCDLNDLKVINDTQGHMAGDEYIKASAKLLCTVFDHSPVFRIGGDEFAIYLSGDDFAMRRSLLSSLHETIIKNRDQHEGPVIAVGMAEFEPDKDANVDEIFDRADHLMYEDKRMLKEMA